MRMCSWSEQVYGSREWELRVGEYEMQRARLNETE